MVVIKLPAHSSSQECVKCNHTHPDNRQTQAKFVCLNCDQTENADLQAAKVMRKRGINAILSAAKPEWKVNSDHTVSLVAKTPAGTRGSARGEANDP